MRDDKTPAGVSNRAESLGREPGLRSRIVGKPRSTPLGSVKRDGVVYSRYRVESVMEVPVATLDAHGRSVPLKQQYVPMPMPSLQQLRSGHMPPPVRSLQDQVSRRLLSRH